MARHSAHPDKEGVAKGDSRDAGRHHPHKERGRDACPVIEVSLVVPVYNEAATVGLFLERSTGCLAVSLRYAWRLFSYNDGSSDAALDRLLEYQRRDSRVRVVDLSRNFGKEATLNAGMRVARGWVVALIDVDLQDPPDLVVEMRRGYDVVLARRTISNKDSRVKRVSATWFYRVHNWIAEPAIPEHVGNFRLMDRTVVDALNALPESGRFMKGLFA